MGRGGDGGDDALVRVRGVRSKYYDSNHWPPTSDESEISSLNTTTDRVQTKLTITQVNIFICLYILHESTWFLCSLSTMTKI